MAQAPNNVDKNLEQQIKECYTKLENLDKNNASTVPIEASNDERREIILLRQQVKDKEKCKLMEKLIKLLQQQEINRLREELEKKRQRQQQQQEQPDQRGQQELQAEINRLREELKAKQQLQQLQLQLEQQKEKRNKAIEKMMEKIGQEHARILQRQRENPSGGTKKKKTVKKTVDYNKYTVEQIRKMAKKKGIRLTKKDGHGYCTKGQLIGKIKRSN